MSNHTTPLGFPAIPTYEKILMAAVRPADKNNKGEACCITSNLSRPNHPHNVSTSNGTRTHTVSNPNLTPLIPHDNCSTSHRTPITCPNASPPQVPSAPSHGSYSEFDQDDSISLYLWYSSAGRPQGINRTGIINFAFHLSEKLRSQPLRFEQDFYRGIYLRGGMFEEALGMEMSDALADCEQMKWTRLRRCFGSDVGGVQREQLVTCLEELFAEASSGEPLASLRGDFEKYSNGGVLTGEEFWWWEE